MRDFINSNTYIHTYTVGRMRRRVLRDYQCSQLPLYIYGVIFFKHGRKKRDGYRVYNNDADFPLAKSCHNTSQRRTTFFQPTNAPKPSRPIGI